MVYLNNVSPNSMRLKQAILLGFSNGVQNRGILNVFLLDLQILFE